jgi:hypothetical protein
MRYVCLVPVLLLTACAPRSGDTAIDFVAAREDPSSGCLSVSGKTRIFSPSGDVPNVAASYDRFRNPAVRKAARSIAVPFGPPQNDDFPRHFGLSLTGSCRLIVDAPVISGDYAFVAFFNPKGEVGVYALLRRSPSSVAERVKLANWL